MGECDIGVSSGTAAALGLSRARQGVPPTTAYLMVGRGCRHACSFCAQGRKSTTGRGQLSRVSWPLYPLAGVVSSLSAAVSRGSMYRACLQVVGGHEELAKTVLAQLVDAGIPVNLSFHVMMDHLVGSYLRAGASRVSLPLDACSPDTFSAIKGADWDQAVKAITGAAREYPGRVATHLVAGLGESEEDLIRVAGDMMNAGVATGLFAFTPVPGTPLAAHRPPDPASYRRLQAVLYLMKTGHTDTMKLKFCDGKLAALGMDTARARELLSGGEAFMTSGCEGCNRPYYNESARGFTYNYPRPLLPEEAAAAVSMVMEGMEQGGERCAL